MPTIGKSFVGTILAICTTGLILYAAGQSSNATVKELAQKITKGFGAGNIT